MKVLRQVDQAITYIVYDEAPEFGSTRASCTDLRLTLAPRSTINERLHFGTFVQDRTESFLSAFDDKIAADLVEIEEENGSVPRADVCERAKALVEELAPRVVLAKRLGFGTFVNDDGSVSIVLQSMITDRRVTFRVTADGQFVDTIQVDEHMKCESSRDPAAEHDRPRRLARWITKRS